MKLKMNQNNSDGKLTEIIKKFNFVSKDGLDSNEVLIIELLGGVYRFVVNLNCCNSEKDIIMINELFLVIILGQAQNY